MIIESSHIILRFKLLILSEGKFCIFSQQLLNGSYSNCHHYGEILSSASKECVCKSNQG